MFEVCITELASSHLFKGWKLVTFDKDFGLAVFEDAIGRQFKLYSDGTFSTDVGNSVKDEVGFDSKQVIFVARMMEKFLTKRGTSGTITLL